mgnify:CR=1 FL=1
MAVCTAKSVRDTSWRPLQEVLVVVVARSSLSATLRADIASMACLPFEQPNEQTRTRLILGCPARHCPASYNCNNQFPFVLCIFCCCLCMPAIFKSCCFRFLFFLAPGRFLHLISRVFYSFLFDDASGSVHFAPSCLAHVRDLIVLRAISSRSQTRPVINTYS